MALEISWQNISSETRHLSVKGYKLNHRSLHIYSREMRWPTLLIPYALIATVALYAAHTIRKVMRRRLMPPGPPGIPVLGNALQMPTTFPWLRFTEWKDLYGMSCMPSVLT
jgi:hypothetical protein